MDGEEEKQFMLPLERVNVLNKRWRFGGKRIGPNQWAKSEADYTIPHNVVGLSPRDAYDVWRYFRTCKTGLRSMNAFVVLANLLREYFLQETRKLPGDARYEMVTYEQFGIPLEVYDDEWKALAEQLAAQEAFDEQLEIAFTAGRLKPDCENIE